MSKPGRIIRFAIRSFRKRPTLALTIIAILTLATGVVTATYSLLDWALLRPLPYSYAQRIYSAGFSQERLGNPRIRASLHDFDSMTQTLRAFQELVINRWSGMSLTTADDSEQIDANVVSPGFFSMFGARLTSGRFFSPTEYFASASPVILLSENLWRRRFHGDPGILGKPVRLNEQLYTVAGVISRDFHDPLEYRRHQPVEVWLPLIRSQEDDQAGIFYIQGLLRPNARASQVRTNLSKLFPNSEARLIGLQDDLVHQFKTQLLLIWGAVLLVLLVACANVGGLLLSRGAGAGSEVAIRVALGARRTDIVRQQLAEAFVLASCAGILGLLLTVNLLPGLKALLPVDLPRTGEIRVDGRVAVFALALVFIVTVACGLWPALRFSHQRLNEDIRRTRNGCRTAAAFVIFQIALSFVLLAGAGLMVKSYWLLLGVNTGFDARNILAIPVRLPKPKYEPPPRRAEFFGRALRSLASAPDVISAAMVTTLPLGGNAFSEAFLVQDYPVRNDNQRPHANWNLVSPEYFRTMRIPLVEGRLPTDTDLSHSKDLMIIDEQIARHYWPHESAIGKRMRFGSVLRPGSWAQVMAVVSDVKHAGLEAPDEPQIYGLYPSLPPPYGNLVVRYRGSAAATAEYVRKAVGQVDRDVAIGRIQTMKAVLSQSVAVPRFRTTILSGFGIFALLLAALGIYGAIAWAVATRSREIGIRMALGASPRRVRYQVITSAARLVGAGLALGSLGAIAFLQALRSFVFATQPLDASVLAGSVALLAVIGVSSAIIPAARAAETDPALALRHE